MIQCANEVKKKTFIFITWFESINIVKFAGTAFFFISKIEEGRQTWVSERTLGSFASASIVGKA
jgi:hypothetical protein